MDTQLLVSGKALRLYGIMDGSECPVREFISSLSEADRRQTVKLLRFRADKLDIYNEEIFRCIGEGIYELKTRNRVRIFCFWGGRGSLVLTHGVFKPKPKGLRREKEKSLACRVWYEKHHNNNKLHLVKK